MMGVSSAFLGTAFVSYVFATIFNVIGVTGRKIKQKDGKSARKSWFTWGYGVAVFGVAAQAIALVTRWIGSGHAPVSDMFEYMSFWAFCIMLAFVVISGVYKFPVLGAFVCPVGVFVLAYASVFSRTAEPLIPALQSYWLYIHVTTAALGEGIFTIGFAAAFMYLLRITNVQEKSRTGKFLEFTVFLFLALFSYVITALAFNAGAYSVQDQTSGSIYNIPPLVGPMGVALGSMTHWLGMSLPLFDVPNWLPGAKSGSNFNGIVWTLIAACIVYGILRLIANRPLVHYASKWVGDVEPEMLDELSYRAIAIGYPIFSLGALVFAMIWAQEAWGQFWSWDPKEVWALITWLYYTLYLHLRLTQGWQGKAAAWMAVGGFAVVLFLLIGVNLVIVGLHSYA